MDWIKFFEILGFIFYSFSFAYATLTINQIVGPDSIEVGSAEELILDCDFEAEGEEDVVLKWFFNGLEDQVYQWIAPNEHAYALGSLKDLIDPTYKISDDPNSMLRALKFKEVSSTLSGNYSCKVDTTDEVKWLTKQVIVYSPADSFQMFLIGEDAQFQGDEVILCDATNILPKPNFELYVSGVNGSLELPELFSPNKTETVDDDGFYNVSITLPFNSSYLDEGTTKFICQLSIPGTNYTERRSVEYFVDNETESSPFELLNEDYAGLNFTSNSTEENSTDDGDNGKNHLHSSLLVVLLLMLSLLLAT